jgi:lysine-specific permease
MNNSTTKSKLMRKLTARILGMITLGGAIGTGIFLASGRALSLAGPGGTLLAYFIVGIMVYFLMTSLGEMAAYMPNTGAFYVYAARFYDPSLGYALGWNYWYSCAVYIASEISACALLMHFWFPDTPSFIWCTIFLILIVTFNVITTKVFGEIEYLMSFLKITVVILFIITGFLIVAGFTNYKAGGFDNWRIGDAPFHGGWAGIINAFVVAGFSFQGTEIIGIAAGESDKPSVNIPKAIKLVFWRILIFYMLSMFVISLLIPYTSPYLVSSEVVMSPFTLVFQQYNKSFAAFIMNAIILLAILSTANSFMYVGSRMLWYLAKKGHVPQLFSRVNRRGIPIYAVALTTAVSMLAFLSSIFGNGTVYFWLLNATSLSGFIAWVGIAISHYRFRKAYLLQGRDLSLLPYVAKGYPFAPLCAFALCIIIIVGQNYEALMANPINWYGLLISYICVPLFLLIWLGHKLINKTKIVPLKNCNFNLD